MFQFPAFAPWPCAKVTGSLPPGCPIRRSAADAGICPSPRLFAACHVLLRLREPRHPPCALFTTCMRYSGGLLFQRPPAFCVDPCSGQPLQGAFYGFGLTGRVSPRGKRTPALAWLLCLTLGYFSLASRPFRSRCPTTGVPVLGTVMLPALSSSSFLLGSPWQS